jgi:tetratricopeptide (TPR) repeat protein
MGTVYRATQLSLGRTVALKVISAALSHDATARERFRGEAWAAARLDHPNLVDVYDAGEADGVTFIAMRFVEGPDLRQLLVAGDGLEIGRGLGLLGQVAGALDAAHAAGLVHRDVKPANILVGPGDRAFLTDFGLTRLVAATDGPTISGGWVGSRDFVAPEQIRGDRLSAATDVYALGCVLYQLLAGRVPFERETVEGSVWAHLYAAPPVPSRLGAGLRPFDAVVARALSKDPGRRYGSAGELARAAAGAGASAASHGSTGRGVGSPASRGSTRRAVVSPADGAGRGPGRSLGSGSRRTGTVGATGLGETEGGPRGRAVGGPARISSRVLVGRGDELAQLHQAVDRAAAGFPSLTCIAGEAGIGKTRLVGELGFAAAAGGVQVLTGACVGLDSCEIPYGPIVGALRAASGEGLTTAVEGLEAGANAELSRALPELFPGAPVLDAGEPSGSAQARLFEVLLGVLRRLAAGATTLLVLEDMHWADPSTRDFVRYFCGRATTERIAVVATFRSDEVDRRHPLRVLLAEVSRSPLVTRIELGRLSRAELAVQLAEIVDAEPEAALVDEIFARSEGNPFFAEELLEMTRSGGGAELPESLRDALLVRIDAVSEPAREVLRAAAVVGRPVDHALLGASTGPLGPLGPIHARLGDLLRELVNGHVLTARGDELAFRHALVREAVYADLLAVERADLHRRVAGALAARDGSNPAELAHHWQAAGEPGPAMAASVDAGLGAARSYSFRDALAHFERALELWPLAGDTQATVALDRPGLFVEAAEAAWAIGEVERAAALCGRALELIDPAGDPARAATTHERLGRYSLATPESALASYGRALELLPPGPSAERARLLGSLGLALTYLDRWEEARRNCEAAVAVARLAVAPAEEARAMSTLGIVLTFLGRPLDGEPMLRRALEIAIELGRASDTARAQINLSEVLRYRGRVGDALAVAVDGEGRARLAGLDLFGIYLSLSAADDLFNLGRWGEAQRRVEALDPDALEPTARELWLSLAGRLAVARGDPDEALRHLTAASELCDRGQLEQVPHVYGALAELALWEGRPAEARRLVTEGLDLIGPSEDALNTPVLLGIGVRATTEAGLAGGGVDREHARAAGKALAGRLEHLLGDSSPPQARAHLAACSAELERLDGAPSTDRWELVAAAWEAIDQPYPAAYARLRCAAAVASARDHAAAQRLLASVCATASRLGAGFLLTEAERLSAAAAAAAAAP